MMNYHLRLVLFLVGGTLLSPLQAIFAQNSPSSQGGAGEVIKTQLAFFSIPGAQDAKDLFLISGAARAMQPIAFNPNAKSPYVYYEGPVALSIYGATADGVPTSQGSARTSPIVVAKATLPKAPQLLILLGPAPKGGSGYSALAIEDDIARFPAGSLRLLNYSGKVIQFKASGRATEMNKGVSAPITIATAGKPTVPFAFELYASESSGVEKAYQTQVQLASNQRLNLLLLPSKRADARGVTVMFLRDEVPVPVPHKK
jgi:hypothetical protein